MTLLQAQRKPGPTYPPDMLPCRRCGILVRKATPKRKSSGYCRDCFPFMKEK
jgi:formamidopyrimidine-DNA glycosylase